jgi:transcriptional regulator with XRE-family HTH domain
MKVTVKSNCEGELNVDVSVDFNIRRIRAYIISQGWSRARAAKEAGLPYHTSLRDIESPDWNPTAAMLRKLEALVPDDFYLAPETEMPENHNKSMGSIRGRIIATSIHIGSAPD